MPDTHAHASHPLLCPAEYEAGHLVITFNTVSIHMRPVCICNDIYCVHWCKDACTSGKLYLQNCCGLVRWYPVRHLQVCTAAQRGSQSALMGLPKILLSTEGGLISFERWCRAGERSPGLGIEAK